MIPDLQERAAIPTIEDLEAARLERKRARKPAAAPASSSSSSSPYADAPRAGAPSLRAEWGKFGVGQRLSYYWPKGEGLVKGAPSLLEAGGGRIGDRTWTSGWAEGGRV